MEERARYNIDLAKGIYFTDCYSKAATNCSSSQESHIEFVFLCEVELQHDIYWILFMIQYCALVKIKYNRFVSIYYIG